MKTSEQKLWMITMAALVAGGGLLAHAILQTPAATEGMQRRVKDLEQIQAYADSLKQMQQARMRLAAEAPARPERLNKIASSQLDPHTFDVQRLEPRDIDPGWRLQRAELTFRNADWKKLDGLLVQAEAHRPPWILESCEIDAGSNNTGSGRLTLQTLERVSE